MDNMLWKTTAIELAEIQKQRKELEKKEAELATKLKDMSNNESYEFEGISYAVSERVGNVEYSKIPELFGIDLEQYRKSSVKVWKLVVGCVS